MDSLTSNCPVCNKLRKYKSKQGLTKGLNKPCKSCSNSIQLGGIGAKYSTEGIKCSKCVKYYPLDNFYIKKQTNTPYSYCKKCHVSASSKYYQETDKYDRYGIDKDTFDSMLEKQNGKCAGCETTMNSPYIDHCHKTGEVRGLLCQPCNSALGMVKDNQKTLENLIEHLKGKNEE